MLGAALALSVAITLFATTANTALPTDPTHGSIRVSDDAPESTYLKLIKVSEHQARKAALSKLPGKIYRWELDEDNGFLVYHVKVLGNNGKTAEVWLDAGNGQVFTIDPEGED